MRKNIVQFVLAWIVLMAFVASAHAETVKILPEFSLPSARDGKKVKSKEFAGKVLLITFFATWCPPCRQEVPTLNKLQKQYESKGFSVIGLSVDEKGPKVVKKMIKKDKIIYPILMAKGKTARAFGGVVGIPTSFLVDKKGMIVKRYPGYIPYARLDADIKDLL